MGPSSDRDEDDSLDMSATIRAFVTTVNCGGIWGLGRPHASRQDPEGPGHACDEPPEFSMACHARQSWPSASKCPLTRGDETSTHRDGHESTVSGVHGPQSALRATGCGSTVSADLPHPVTMDAPRVGYEAAQSMRGWPVVAGCLH